MKLNIDKSNWTPVSFGDVVAERRKTTKDPVAEGLAHIVGLEHIDGESIHLRRSDPITADTTFTKKFKKGDVLFGRRRAYLKKAAQAPFSGICSGDITVMYAKDELIPELLPFLINNDKFFDYAVEHSAGGLSPRVKFRDLANYQFLLPPKAEQARLAELLWAGDGVLEGLERVKNMLLEAQKSFFMESFDRDNIKFDRLRNIASLSSGGTPSRKKLEYWNGEIPWIKTGEVRYNIITDTEEKITISAIEQSAARLIPEGAILMAMYGQGDTRGRVAITGIEASCNQACAIIELTSEQQIRPVFSYFRFRYENIRMLAHGANQQNLNLEILRNLKVPVLGESQVTKFNLQNLRLENSVKNCIGEIESTRALQKSLINQIF